MARLRAAPGRFDLVCAVRALGGDPDRIRLTSARSLGFPATEVVSVDGADLTVAPLALGGAGSPLPACYAEDLAAMAEDGPAAGLIDLIQHRLLALLHRALTDARAVDDPAGFAALVAGLAGGAAAGFLPFSGLLAAPPSAEALARVAAIRAGVAVAVISCTPRWYVLAAGGSPGLGAGRLGRDTVIGTQVRLCSASFLVEIGPVAWTDAPRFRPGGSGLADVRASIAGLDHEGLDHRIDLLVATAGAPESPLGSALLGGDARLAGPSPACLRETVFETGPTAPPSPA